MVLSKGCRGGGCGVVGELSEELRAGEITRNGADIFLKITERRSRGSGAQKLFLITLTVMRALWYAPEPEEMADVFAKKRSLCSTRAWHGLE